MSSGVDLKCYWLGILNTWVFNDSLKKKQSQAYGIIKLLKMFCCSGFINNTCLKVYFLYISLGTTGESSHLSLKRTDSGKEVNEVFIHAISMPQIPETSNKNITNFMERYPIVSFICRAEWSNSFNLAARERKA